MSGNLAGAVTPALMYDKDGNISNGAKPSRFLTIIKNFQSLTWKFPIRIHINAYIFCSGWRNGYCGGFGGEKRAGGVCVLVRKRGRGKKVLRSGVLQILGGRGWSRFQL